ncbi:hypothetical protein [Streptomyces longispororuber]|uniref:hypothetical protein n=1 Tax=Streptomyces longispororuber TaxID=68230 RepID=UPI00370001CA
MSTPQQPVPSADDFLMGGSVPSAKFPTLGATLTGQIASPPTVEQQRDYTTGDLKFWDDGKPQMQMVVTLATAERDPAVADDDGTRRLYVKGQMKTAIAQAVRASGARGLEVGGQLTVKYVRDGEKKNPRFNAPKEYAAQYVPAAAAHLGTVEQVNTATGEITTPPPGLTSQQYAAAQQHPATAALSALAQQAARPTAPAPAPQPGDEPPF